MMNSKGYTIVELLVTMAIIAILAAVAVPSYVNYRHRASQGDAVEALLRAKMDQELFWADNNRYANTIGCLYSFGNTCSRITDTSRNYTIRITGTGAARVIAATRWIRTGNTFDVVTIAAGNTSPETARPVFPRPNALGVSIFQMVFN